MNPEPEEVNRPASPVVPVTPAPATAETIPPPASSAAPDLAQAPPVPQPVAPAATAPPMATMSASSVLGKILGYAASVLGGIIPTMPIGIVTEAATISEGVLRAVAEWLTTRGSDNALTEAQAEASLQGLLKNLATLTAPLPTPSALESAPASPPARS